MFVICALSKIINNMLRIDMYISLFICIHSMEYYGDAKNNPHLTSFSIAKYALFGKHEQVIHLLVVVHGCYINRSIGRVDQSRSFLLEVGMLKPYEECKGECETAATN